LAIWQISEEIDDRRHVRADRCAGMAPKRRGWKIKRTPEENGGGIPNCLTPFSAETPAWD
jgi:hypothetical protein